MSDQGSVWDAFSHDPRLPSTAGLRASDRDRGVVEQVLAEAYADGRLDREELDDRTTRAAAARTLGELPPLVGDLVADPGTSLSRRSGADLQAQAAAAYRSDRREALMGFLGPSLVCVVIWLVVNGGHAGFFWPGFVIVGTGINLVRTLVMREELVEGHRRRLEKKSAKELERRRRDEPGDR